MGDPGINPGSNWAGPSFFPQQGRGAGAEYPPIFSQMAWCPERPVCPFRKNRETDVHRIIPAHSTLTASIAALLVATAPAHARPLGEGSTDYNSVPPVRESLQEIGLAELAAQILADEELNVENGDALIEAVLDPELGGLDAARERGFLRMAVAPDPLMIAFDGEAALGVAISIATELEIFLSGLPGASPTPTVVVPTPTPRNAIVDSLVEGRTDFSTLTVSSAEETEELQYTQALIEDVNDVPVLSPDLEGIETIDDLVGIPIYVQENGRYAANLERLNAARAEEGKELLTVRLVDERLDDYDLMELVEIGVIRATVATDFKANFWNTIYTSAVVRDDIELTPDGRIVWSVRESNDQLLETLDDFADIAKKGTLLGNVVLNQYADSADWIENIGTEDSRRLIDEVGPVIERYSDEYGFESELVIAQAYQESRLDQTKRSHVGAIGVMQVMPTTAADPVVGIPDVTTLDNNVNAGIKYLRWLRDTFFDDPEISTLDQTLLSFAAYNAGPGGVRRAQKRAVELGLDPNVWFENVEVAIQQAVSREPAIYVRNIFKYYVSARLLEELEAEAEVARESVGLIEDAVPLSVEDRRAIVENNSREAGPPDTATAGLEDQ